MSLTPNIIIPSADPSKGHCSQAVLLMCLHLGHEMVLRDVGLYAWTIPQVKDPSGSTMKIMKRRSTYLHSPLLENRVTRPFA